MMIQFNLTTNIFITMFFFFSSRRRHTRSKRDWSSDVCSSDLNYTCGEGGALLVNHKPSIERAEIIQEKGTNRSQFVRGMVDKYTWRDLGSSFLLSELNAAFLYAQLENANQIYENRMQTWKYYYQKLYPLMEAGYIKLPTIPEECIHNAHMFYLKMKNGNERQALMNDLKDNDIMAV